MTSKVSSNPNYSMTLQKVERKAWQIEYLEGCYSCFGLAIQQRREQHDWSWGEERGEWVRSRNEQQPVLHLPSSPRPWHRDGTRCSAGLRAESLPALQVGKQPCPWGRSQRDGQLQNVGFYLKHRGFVVMRHWGCSQGGALGISAGDKWALVGSYGISSKKNPSKWSTLDTDFG